MIVWWWNNWSTLCAMWSKERNSPTCNFLSIIVINSLIYENSSISIYYLHGLSQLFHVWDYYNETDPHPPPAPPFSPCVSYPISPGLTGPDCLRTQHAVQFLSLPNVFRRVMSQCQNSCSLALIATHKIMKFKYIKCKTTSIHFFTEDCLLKSW